ncbi:uncharacterized protein LOC114265028 isoform X7 [Camellia sinensis]|uniref:uncharacterized protein LOC114265028 isoform X7 n=1 Tax=Camellia sinensis TaxID=4442 RepID=UPI0010364A03|nr:uncharacterized protein LOC114265028 isoform X7 [Camellia sinensis]XP_028061570.1 uncharacterized protein LOC114265028 isoform X7 [Camellia sinensis]
MFLPTSFCLIPSFRIRDDHRHPQTHLVSEPLPSKLREPVVSRNPLSSLLLTDDKDGLPYKDKENPCLCSLVLGMLLLVF